MKYSYLLAFLAISASSFATAQCRDARLMRFEKCDSPGEKRFFIQGNCPKSYQIESSFCADIQDPECKDIRTFRFAGCPDGGRRKFYRGRCEASYEFEHSYCSELE